MQEEFAYSKKGLLISFLGILFCIIFIETAYIATNEDILTKLESFFSSKKDISEKYYAASIIAASSISAIFFIFFRNTTARFSDIDKYNIIYKKIVEEIEKQKDNSEEIQATPTQGEDEKEKYNSFHSYFNSIIISLNEQIDIADRKASLLLDKGTSYSRNGIYLYVFIIVLWQAITWITDLQTRHIYGIASCSLLFIFIEFLSAWFLKQYRHFVDTSTYLIKLRSTLERYILTYLALKEVKANGGNFDPLIDLLKSEIKWPEMAQKGMQDVSAPKELIDSLSNLCSAFKKSN